MSDGIELKHTPGPWHYGMEPVSGGEKREPWEFNIYESGSGWEGCIAHLTNSGKATEANARLIAAAPELLNALKAINPLLPEDTQTKIEALIVKAEPATTEGR